ncbi:MAG: HAD family hydrolase [Desulfomonilaceae bacterium]|nr:HAD family hydrolase [Desulfomonilaceae bacterium]
MDKFILFDIDQTLLESGGGGLSAMTKAFKVVTGISNGFNGISYAGKTDPQIIREALEAHGLSVNGTRLNRLIDVYLRYFPEEMASRGGRLKPGVLELVERLHQRRDRHLGLLTGNVEKGARIKLGHFGLNKYFSVGAFGSDSEDRNVLLPIALRRFRHQTGMPVTYRDCIVIGDTPRDVECARVHETPCIGVATGSSSVSDLKAAEADLVVEDLTDTEAILEWIASL